MFTYAHRQHLVNICMQGCGTEIFAIINGII